MFRTHTCGELHKEHLTQEVTLSGWVHRRRDHGGVIFIDLRDRYGLTQIVFDPDHNADALAVADSCRSEYVIQIKGTVRLRPEGQENTRMVTGAIEVICHEVTILNKAKTTPFEIDQEKKVGEEVRMKYRYLDLRKERMQKNLTLRHDIFFFTRDFFRKERFLEIETPIMIKGTPEGSREYIVPSRVHPGKFYVLPQSPQQLKQLLMVAGFDRYMQMARCMRDEDLRGDRQPEFTQLDVEMSFVEQKDILDVFGRYIIALTHEFASDKKVEGVEGDAVRIMTWQEAMDKYGIDKPDLRFGMEIEDLGELVKDVQFQVFQNALANGGVVRGIKVTAPDMARSFIDNKLTPLALENGAKGLAYFMITEEGVKAPIAKFFTEEQIKAVVEKFEAKPGDIIFFAADEFQVVCDTLGALRLFLGDHLGLRDPNVFAYTWVVDFPMFERDKESGQLSAVHHPFTRPKEGHLEHLEKEPLKARAVTHDLVLNGIELGGGSVRIHEPELQSQIFDIMGISKEDAERRFGHMLEAFTYGAPPHGGCALGMDRIVMLFAGEPNIREVLAFPKTSKAEDLMLGAPDVVDQKTLDELLLRLVKPVE